MSEAGSQDYEPRGIDPISSRVRAVAVVGTIFAVLGLSCLPFNLGAWITYGWPIQGSKSTPIDMWCFASTFIGLGLAAMLLWGSLAAYHFRWWARDLLLLWAILSLAYGILGIYFWGRFLLPALREQYAEMRGPDEVSGLIAWIIGTGLSIFVLRTMMRPSTRALFEEARHRGVAIAGTEPPPALSPHPLE